MGRAHSTIAESRLGHGTPLEKKARFKRNTSVDFGFPVALLRPASLEH